MLAWADRMIYGNRTLAFHGAPCHEFMTSLYGRAQPVWSRRTER